MKGLLVYIRSLVPKRLDDNTRISERTKCFFPR